MSSGIQVSIWVRAGAVKERFDSFLNESAQKIRETLREAAVAAVGLVAAYPEENTREMKWVSEKQRRYVMWAIAKGIIQVPRPRTGEYGASWNVENYSRGVRIRSSYPAAKYVAGSVRNPDEQAVIHRGRWESLRDAVETSIAGLPEDIRNDIALVARRKGLAQ